MEIFLIDLDFLYSRCILLKYFLKILPIYGVYKKSNTFVLLITILNFKKMKKIFLSVAVVALAVAVTSCRDAKKEDQIVDETEQAVQDAAHAVENTVEDVIDATDQAIQDAVDTVEDAAQDVEQKVEEIVE